MIRAKVNIETAKKIYKPGEVIGEKLSDADMAFLKMHGFITDDSDVDYPDEDDFEDDTDGKEESRKSAGITPPGAEGGESGAEYRDEAALKKLNKDEIVEYAASIGLSLDADMLKSDMIDSVLNYIEEKAVE